MTKKHAYYSLIMVGYGDKHHWENMRFRMVDHVKRHAAKELLGDSKSICHTLELCIVETCPRPNNMHARSCGVPLRADPYVRHK